MNKRRVEPLLAKVVSAKARRGELVVRLLYEGEAEPVEINLPAAMAGHFAAGDRLLVLRELPGPRPRVTVGLVKRTIRELGGAASQQAVAEALGVDARTIQRASASSGMSWRELTADAFNFADEIREGRAVTFTDEEIKKAGL